MTSFRSSGRIGLPPNVKEGGKRVDFKKLNSVGDTDFDFLIETKCPRFAWSRAQLCPCVGFNDQTEQFDPNCPLCNGLGWHAFRPSDYVVDETTIGELTDTQKAIIERANAVVIKALMTGSGREADMFAVLGNWALGDNLCTVRPGNRVGYYDRLLALDDEMVFSETFDTDGTGRWKPRYPIIDINGLRTLDGVLNDDDVELDAGDLVWKTGREPTTGTRVSIHYNCWPVWVVINHTKLNRTSLVKAKQARTKTPEGDIQRLPQQVMVRLEHLPLNPASD